MKKYLFILLLLSILGLFDALYLTYEHYHTLIPPCSLHAWFADCGKVLLSSYATVFGIPVSLLGVLYYIVLLCLLALSLFEKNAGVRKLISRLLFLVATGGFLGALYFISLQLFFLHAICVYCMFSDTNDILIFFLVAHLAYTSSFFV